MRIEHDLILHSKDALRIFQKRVGKNAKRSLFELVLSKISTLMHLMREEEVYAFEWLLRIRQALDDYESTLQKACEELSKVLSAQGVDLQTFRHADGEKVTIVFDNPLVFQVIKMLEHYDHYILLLMLTKNTSIQMSKENYFAMKTAKKMDLLSLFNTILKLPQTPEVVIRDYLNNAKSYQDAAKKLGEIVPENLYSALNLNFTPFISDEVMQEYTQRLQEIAAQAVAGVEISASTISST